VLAQSRRRIRGWLSAALIIGAVIIPVEGHSQNLVVLGIGGIVKHEQFIAIFRAVSFCARKRIVIINPSPNIKILPSISDFEKVTNGNVIHSAIELSAGTNHVSTKRQCRAGRERSIWEIKIAWQGRLSQRRAMERDHVFCRRIAGVFKHTGYAPWWCGQPA
jgi:hypothetical protein